MKRALVAMSVAGTLVIGSLAFASASQAATPDEIAEWIADAALENLGLSVESPELEEAIADAVRQALEAGLIQPEVEDAAAGDAEDDDALDETLEEQTGIWDEIKAAWRVGHEEAHAAFTECREAAEGGADECAHEFRYAMQVNNIAAFQARHEARLLADADTMTPEELAKAEQKLAHHNAVAMARLERAAAHLAKKTVQEDVEDATDDALETIEATSSVEPRGNNGNGNGNGANKPADQGNNGKAGNGEHPGNGKAGNNGSNGNKGGNGKGNPNR